MSTSDQDSRRSFRVSERVYLKFEIISNDEFSRGLDHRKIRLGRVDGVRSKLVDLDARLEEKLFLLHNESSRLAECLNIMNEKVNTVIEQLPELRQSKASLARTEPQPCEIGADGMAFAAEEKLDVGTKLSLRFLLESDNRYIETFAEVVREVEPPEESSEDRPFGVAVEFSGMKPAQREILIQHLFNRESETLRMRRLRLDAAELTES